MLATHNQPAARREPPRWGGTDGIVQRLVRLEDQLSRIEAALVGLVEREAERFAEDQPAAPAVDRRSMLTVSEVAPLLGITLRQVTHLCATGRIRAVRWTEGARPWLIDRAEVTRYQSEGPLPRR